MTHKIRKGRCEHCGALTSWALITQPCPVVSAYGGAMPSSARDRMRERRSDPAVKAREAQRARERRAARKAS